jgi:hypothetical protein
MVEQVLQVTTVIYKINLLRSEGMTWKATSVAVFNLHLEEIIRLFTH